MPDSNEMTWVRGDDEEHNGERVAVYSHPGGFDWVNIPLDLLEQIEVEATADTFTRGMLRTSRQALAMSQSAARAEAAERLASLNALLVEALEPLAMLWTPGLARLVERSGMDGLSIATVESGPTSVTLTAADIYRAREALARVREGRA